MADRPPRAPPVNTVILHNNGRDGDAQVLLRARDARGRLVDPVGRVEKLKEEADSGVHQRETWTSASFRRTLATLGPFFELSETVCSSPAVIFASSTVHYNSELIW